MRAWAICLIALLLLSSSGAARAEPPRIALVIGNSTNAGSGSTSLKDAGLVARVLSQSGFAVTAAGDVDRGRLESCFDGFLAEAANAGSDATIVVYLAGHGLQYAGSVYFVPIGAILARDVDIPSEAISVTAFTQRLEALPAKARVFLLDLARETPFPMIGSPIAGGLPLSKPAAGTIVALNAAPGTLAVPDVAPYGIYARALAEVIATTSLPVSAQLERVRMRIGMLSNGANVPWTGGTIEGGISLGLPGGASPLTSRPGADAKAAVGAAEAAYVAALASDTLDDYTAFLATYPDDPLAARVRAMVAARREALLWNETLRADLDRAYWTYMRRYRRGPHVADAKRRLAILQAVLEPPPRFDIYFYTSAAPPEPWEVTILERPFIILDDPSWRQTPVTDVGLPAPALAFYEDLPPPPLVPAGALPIADPVARRESGAITQPDVPSIGSIVCETRIEPDGSWIAASRVEGKTLFKTHSSNANGIWTALQTGPDGMVFSKTTVTRTRDATTIFQTGPDGGILTKAVTRGDGGGGRSTVLTNGGNQMIAIVQVDSRGVTTAKRGPVAARDLVLVLGATPADRPSIAFATPPVAAPLAQPAASFAPQPPPPLAMPAAVLPVAVVPTQALAPGPGAPSLVVPPSPPASSATPPPPARASPELPKIAPLPPRRVKSAARTEAAASPNAVAHGSSSAMKARRPTPGRKP